MKFLHTSDWHIGRTLYGRKRYDEFKAFLEWVSDTIVKEHVDVLLVAGDIFDTSTPSNKAQQLYYEFLCKVANSCCRHVVIIGGNHDSPSFLNAPQALLKALHVHVVGAMSQNLEDEIIVLGDLPEAVICAVPYLRDKDIRTLEAGETIDSKNAKLVAGLHQHYKAVCELAEEKRLSFINQDIPVIGMGHLFAAGGQTMEGDGVRDLYVGSLAHVGADLFPNTLDYVALGHLHVPQKVAGQDRVRYSGSPIPMGYGEANQRKIVCMVEFEPASKKPIVSEIDVPCFQKLVRIVGDQTTIMSKVEALKETNAWLEIEYTGEDVVGRLREDLDELIQDTQLEILRVKNKRMAQRVMQVDTEETLEDLNPHDVFDRVLNAFEVPEENRPELLSAYNSVLQSMNDEDKRAD
ncbi:MAG: exonuclease SbcCD subunit D C-terminal domain-containing protein [Pseudomonadota bacterium]|nr:exonuclease SbcCD subunit D C-terminal domain-containing protein [Pseudomonadota bacterium]